MLISSKGSYILTILTVFAVCASLMSYTGASVEPENLDTRWTLYIYQAYKPNFKSSISYILTFFSEAGIVADKQVTMRKHHRILQHICQTSGCINVVLYYILYAMPQTLTFLAVCSSIMSPTGASVVADKQVARCTFHIYKTCIAHFKYFILTII